MLSFKQINTLRGAAGRHAAGVTRGAGRSAGRYVAGIALEVHGEGCHVAGRRTARAVMWLGWRHGRAGRSARLEHPAMA